MTITDPEARVEAIKQEQSLLDSSFFSLLSRLMESAMLSGDQEAAKRLEAIQNDLLEHTEFGKQIKSQTEEVQAAVRSLQAVGKGLTREKLLDIVMEAPNEIRLSALVSLVRPAMDYEFFRLLSERIDRARGKGRERLIGLREQLLELTGQYDQQIRAREDQVRELLNEIIQSEDPAEATRQALPAIDEIFLSVLNSEMEAARKQGDLERIGQLQKVINVVQEASAPPPEVELVEELLEAPDEQSRRKLLEEHREEITPEFMQMLASLLSQIQGTDQDPELVEKLKSLNRQVLRFSMEANLRG
jgi:hypothetical protein